MISFWAKTRLVGIGSIEYVYWWYGSFFTLGLELVLQSCSTVHQPAQSAARDLNPIQEEEDSRQVRLKAWCTVYLALCLLPSLSKISSPTACQKPHKKSTPIITIYPATELVLYIIHTYTVCAYGFHLFAITNYLLWLSQTIFTLAQKPQYTWTCFVPKLTQFNIKMANSARTMAKMAWEIRSVTNCILCLLY